MYFMLNNVKEEWNEAGFPYVDYVIKPSTTFIHIMSDKDEPTNYHGHIDIYMFIQMVVLQRVVKGIMVLMNLLILHLKCQMLYVILYFI